MKSVGIRLLKDKLSKYLKLVRNGEVILVTDRDQVIAEIRQPVRAVQADATRFQVFIEDAAVRGSITMAAAREIFPKTLKDSPGAPIAADTADLLEESRQERE